MYKTHKRSLYKIQIYTREKQNRLTLQAEYDMILVLGGLLAALFAALFAANKKSPFGQ